MYQLPTSFLYDSSQRNLNLIIHVPLYRESHILSLYCYIPAPVKYPTNDQALFLEIKPPKNYLARSRDGTLTRSLSDQELLDCLSIGHTYFCDDQALEKPFPKACLTNLFNGLTNETMKHCECQLHPSVEMISRLNKTTYLIASSTTTTITAECTRAGKLQPYTNRILPGTYYLTVDPSCTTTADYWVISPTESIKDVLVSSLQINNHIDPSIFLSDIPEHELKHIGSSINQIGQPVSLSHIQSLISFKKALEENHREYAIANAVITPTATIIIICVILAVLWITYRAIKRRRQQRQRLDDAKEMIPLREPIIRPRKRRIDKTPADGNDGSEPMDIDTQQQTYFQFPSLN